jgi:CBS domain-containing protein
MKVKELMTDKVIRIRPEESVEVAARALAHYNIGALPVCGENGKLLGMVTDRDLVIRCMAANRSAAETTVGQIMTGQVQAVEPDMDAQVAAHLMGRKQIRRLPVTENGRLCGIVSLADVARQEATSIDAADALQDISSQVQKGY